MKHIITLPNGRSVTLGEYARSWRILTTLQPDHDVARFCHFTDRADEIIRRIREGIHDRINRHIPGYGVGRNWHHDRQRTLIQSAHNLNTPRLVIHWLPPDLARRFPHRLRNPADY